MRNDLKGYEVIDAENLVLGRMGTSVAKMLMQGRKVAIVNAEKAIITGNRSVIVARYNTRRNLQEKENPEHSPHWPRRPDLLVKRIIRGMLPYRKSSGKEAYRNLYVFIGVPEVLKGVKPKEVRIKNLTDVYMRYMTVSELSERLGY